MLTRKRPENYIQFVLQSLTSLNLSDNKRVYDFKNLQDVKDAKRALLMRLHPDRNPGKDTNSEFSRVRDSFDEWIYDLSMQADPTYSLRVAAANQLIHAPPDVHFHAPQTPIPSFPPPFPSSQKAPETPAYSTFASMLKSYSTRMDQEALHTSEPTVEPPTPPSSPAVPRPKRTLKRKAKPYSIRRRQTRPAKPTAPAAVKPQSSFTESLFDLSAEKREIFKLCLGLDIPDDMPYLKTYVQDRVKLYEESSDESEKSKLLESFRWLCSNLPTYINIFQKLRSGWPDLDAYLKADIHPPKTLEQLFTEGTPVVQMMKTNKGQLTITYIPVTLNPGATYAFHKVGTGDKTSVKQIRNFSASLSTKQSSDALQDKRVFCTALCEDKSSFQSKPTQ